jgi:hypothetical protein
MRETDLYSPIRDFLTAQGYEVQGEVKGCDVVARKGDDLIVIELKRHFGTRLLVQAIDRQKITDSVYVALPKSHASSAHGRRRSRDIRRLLRRLELGLIVVELGQEPPVVEIVFHPLPYQRQKRSRRARAVIQEVNARSGDYNQGGSPRGKAITAYRENAIYIACCLATLGPSTPRRLRDLGTGPKTKRILSSNFYGWFRRVDRGVYELTPVGHSELRLYPELAARYQQQVSEAMSERIGPSQEHQGEEDPKTC